MITDELVLLYFQKLVLIILILVIVLLGHGMSLNSKHRFNVNHVTSHPQLGRLYANEFCVHRIFTTGTRTLRAQRESH